MVIGKRERRRLIQQLPFFGFLVCRYVCGFRSREPACLAFGRSPSCYMHTTILQGTGYSSSKWLADNGQIVCAYGYRVSKGRGERERENESI